MLNKILCVIVESTCHILLRRFPFGELVLHLLDNFISTLVPGKGKKAPHLIIQRDSNLV
jgi:hypothetical protein